MVYPNRQGCLLCANGGVAMITLALLVLAVVVFTLAFAVVLAGLALVWEQRGKASSRAERPAAPDDQGQHRP